MKTTRLKVTLRDVEPRVLRVLDVPADSTLGDLHDLLQIALGWLDLEPHRFFTGSGSTIGPEADGHLTELGPAFRYRYNLRACWEHDVAVLGPGGDQVGCVYGEGVCPPETADGPQDYAERFHHLDERTRDLFWAPHRPEFDQALTDLRVRQMNGLVPESVRILVRLVSGGVRLVPGSGLPPEIVRTVLAVRPEWHENGSPDHETGLPPLQVLHGILRSTGVLVQELGRVRPSEATVDDQFVVRRLRSWFAPGTFGATVAGLAVGALGARGALDEETLVYTVLRETDRSTPVGAEDIRHALLHLLPALTGLDLARRTPSGWHPGPSARTLLPRATALSVYAPLPPIQTLTGRQLPQHG